MAERGTGDWHAEAHCESCTVRDAVLFGKVNDEQLKRMRRSVSECVVEANSRLYRIGEPGDALFTVRSGLVKLVQYLADGSERIVRLVRSCDNTGLEALLGQPYQHDAIAQQRSLVCRIPVKVIRQLGNDDPQLYQELMLRWQHALNEADAWLTELATGSARQRLTRLLLRIVDANGVGVCDLFGRKDIAAMLGVTTETASRLVAEFKREGLIAETDGKFTVALSLLHEIAED